MKNLYIAEKPSVAREFAKALGMKGAATAGARDGYLENEDTVVTWCVGHLITMSYPEVYDPALKKWSFDTIPFIPEEYKYEIIDASSKQFQIVSRLLNREDVGRIYVCTDSGREGEYIYRLVEQMAGVDKSKKDRRRVWIDSQTEEEIMRGIREAKELSAYDNLSDAAYLRAQEDYLMGINFSRALSLKYSYTVRNYLGMDRCVIAVGRVMTCVLGMIVKREREIRQFVPTPFYRVLASTEGFEAEWKTTKDSAYLDSPLLYKENGFKKEESAKQLITELSADAPIELIVQKVEKKTEKKAPPMLYNLAELQNDCSRLFKISPTDTLNTVQTLYERKLVTYPRTDARVLSTAVAKEIGKNIGGLQKYEPLAQYAQYIMQQGGYKGVAKSKYVNDKQITDHYAIIPTGQGLGNLNGLNDIQRKVYDIIARRFLSIFFPAAEYEKVSLVLSRQIHTVVGEKENGTESFFANFKRLKNPGYLTIAGLSSDKKQEEQKLTDEELAKFASLKKGDAIPVQTFNIKEGETSPPKRYSSGTLILAMENAGQLIEDEELRSQIKGSGIGTSATRDSIITKLVTNKYIALNKKTQIVTPTFLGEIIYDVCLNSIQSLLWAEMTASWEKGLSGVAEGTISKDEYTAKMNKFVCDNTNAVKQIRNQNQITRLFDRTKPFYEKAGAKKAAKKS
ncbi:DNA topoisomerase [Wujia chipingensis]|uniref:DNA topoisomerase n=1 Tax=Wujia chipingensis TaxID=2763670 RepID=A0A7G9FJQ9_9FIRM|nr:DNA topoisomerase [Wujia chipingensis]QNL98790.1 type IA DNA topoisomerase [Wujia chipingensis]RHS89805.1 type IA DNA topoisomerase [Clostridium sp. AM42-36]